jgi:two-component system chemotaxis response regulator CheB
MNIPPKKIRVLIVDDSALVRRLEADVLRADPEIEVVGAAVDPYMARDLIEKLSPDVLTLDLEMPRMDGLTFLGLLMEQRPMPVVVISSLTRQGSEHALESLRLGAVDVLGKPTGAFSFRDLAPQLIAKVKAAAEARIRPSGSAGNGSFPRRPEPPRRAPPPPAPDPRSLVLLGASTGGTEALRELLTALPANAPAIAVVQHIPATFSTAFAKRLDSVCEIEVREAVDGDQLRPGLALIAPGNFHLMVNRGGGGWVARVTDGPMVWHQRPAVDLLFKSAAESGAASGILAGVLTGMGKDGAEGLLALLRNGATTFAQDEATSVVYGMPRAAREIGAAQTILPLGRMASFIIERAPQASALAGAASP